MATEKHTTIVEVDVSAAVAAEDRLKAATNARMEAARRVAAMLDEAERARINTLLASENEAKRVEGSRKEALRVARQAVAAAKEEENAIKALIAEEKKREQALRRTADAGNAAAGAVAGIGKSGGSFVDLGARIGSIATGLQSMAAAAERVVKIADSAMTDSLKAQQVSAGLQVSIGGAREAFKGYVDDLELARIANMAFELGVVTTGKELEELARGVQVKAERLGVSSTQLFDNAVVAIGRQSRLILDNLGIILDQETAQIRYAEALGKTVDELTAYEKSQAFAKVATMEIAAAGKEATVAIDGMASSWAQAKVNMENFKTSMLGFDDSLGTLRENLRTLDADALRKLSTGGVQDMRDILDTQALVAKNQGELFQAQANYATRHAELLREEARRYERQALTTQNEEVAAQARAEADRLNLEAMAEEEKAAGRLALAREEMADAAARDQGEWNKMLEAAAGVEGTLWSPENIKKRGETLRREAQTALAFVEKQQKEAAKLQAEADKAAEAKRLESEADEIEHQADLLEKRNAPEKEILFFQRQSLELRALAAEAIGEEEKALEFRRKAELAAIPDKKKSGGKKKDPNEALDRETKATLRLLDAREQIYAAELEGERDLDSVAKTREYLITLEREELAIREKANEQRIAKKADDKDKVEAERLAILTERRLLDIEATTLARDEQRRAAEENIAAMDREIERQAALGVATGLLEKRRADANLAMVATFGSAEELRDLEHEREVIRLEEREAWRVRTAESELAAFEREVAISKARGQTYVDEADARLALQIKIAEAEGNDDKRRQLYHQREVQRIEDRRTRFARAQQATNSLIGASVGLAESVANATMKNEAKREKFVLRVRGVEAVARGAAETVEAAASIAAFNYPQAVLHGIAAATAFATGIPMIAGVVPGKTSAASAAGGMSGGADHQTVVSNSGTGSERPSLPATPPSAEELIRLRNGQATSTQNTAAQGGGTVINIGTMVAGDAGTILRDMGEQTPKKWGRV